jgi:hypothetical protein
MAKNDMTENNETVQQYNHDERFDESERILKIYHAINREHNRQNKIRAEETVKEYSAPIAEFWLDCVSGIDSAMEDALGCLQNDPEFVRSLIKVVAWVVAAVDATTKIYPETLAGLEETTNDKVPNL